VTGVQTCALPISEDEQLLPPGTFTDLLENAGNDSAKASRRIEKLFLAMQQKGGEYGDHDIAWFNGGLFTNIEIPALTASELQQLHRAASDMGWRAIDPTIFGTLFERGLDPSARAPLGAHYTDTGTIAKLINPLVSEPLAMAWQNTRQQIAQQMSKTQALEDEKAAALKIQVTAQNKQEIERKLTAAKTSSTKALNQANKLYAEFLLRLNQFRVLDPACGSGNFLYLALKALRDVEKHVQIEA
jgi:hypothetical protein